MHIIFIFIMKGPRIIGTIKTKTFAFGKGQAQPESKESTEELMQLNRIHGQEEHQHSKIINPFRQVYPVPFSLTGRRRSTVDNNEK